VCLPIAAMSLQGEEEGMHQRNGSAPCGEEEDLHQRNGSAKKGAEKGYDGWWMVMMVGVPDTGRRAAFLPRVGHGGTRRRWQWRRAKPTPTPPPHIEFLFRA
jgi:hypothetical protein